MPAVLRPLAELPALLIQEAAQVDWVVLVGLQPSGQVVELVAAARAGGAVVLVVEPDPLRLEPLRQELKAEGLSEVSLVADLLAAEAGEQCWYRYNDSRWTGTTPPERIQQQRPNLQLISLELRPALPLADVLEQWPLLAEGQPAPGDGLLLVAAETAPAVLQGAGSWLRRMATVLVPSPQELDPELDPLLLAACLERQASDPALLLWRRSPLLVLQREQLELEQQRDQLTAERDGLTAERDALAADRDQIAAQKLELEQRLAQVNTELDEILALLDAADPPADN
ncbi:MAG: hypothetical protein R6W06_02950, partial [Prochlorococcaceae cyanobacterium]